MSENRVEETTTSNGAKRASVLGTWPGKIAAAAATAMIGSAVSYFLGADFWEGLRKRAGVAPEPLSVHVNSSGVRQLNPTFVTPRPIAAIGPPPSGDRPEGRYSWAHKLGGVDTWTYLRVTVTGKSPASVVLQDLRIKVTSRRPPLNGYHLSYNSVRLGKMEPTREIEVDLDSSPPRWRFAEDSRGARFPFSVSNSEIEVFDISTETTKCDCSWTAELSYVADGEQGVTTIDDNGKPFRTTAPSKAESVYWHRGRWRSFGREGA